MFNDTVENLQLTYEEAKFLVALLKVNNQTALQLLNAEHLYKPRLLPKLQQLEHMLKKGITELDPD
jgi:hypothetical protein